MVTYDKNGNTNLPPNGFDVPQTGQFQLILIMHDESTFYANDCHKNFWSHKSDPHTPDRKGEGPSLMISKFQTSEWGHLQDGNEQVFYVLKSVALN